MRITMTMMAAALVVGLLMLTPMTGMVGAEDVQENPLDRISLETGTTEEFDGGDYVAVNMTKGDSFAWFGVVYGTEAEPAPITIAGMTMRFMGGAQVVDENGGLMATEVPIPVMTLSAQRLFALFEFNDTGYQTWDGRYGAGNGLFDFAGDRHFADFSMGTFEPVYRAVDLSQAWELSEIEETVDAANGTKRYDFALTARNLTYAWVADTNGIRPGTEADGVLDLLEFRFHITASAQEMVADVPMYRVTLGGEDDVIASEPIGTKEYTGISVGTDFKYDHVIEGWDYTARSNSTRLCLENGVMFATFVPNIVQSWIDAQFCQNRSSTRAMLGLVGGDTEVSDTDDLPRHSTRMAKNHIDFVDDWDRIGRLTWVSNVTVDGEEDQMYYQVHAGTRGMIEGDDGAVQAIVILGGYIYPAGESIFHDSTLEVQSFLVPMEMSIEPGLVLGTAIAAAVVCLLAVGVAVAVRSRRNRQNFRQPPQRP